MATYKKGFKKQNPQLTVLKTIIAIIASVAVLLLVAFIYDKATEWKDYKSYEHIETYDKVLTMDEDNYVVYFYSKGCPTCAEIKEDVLKSISKENKKDDLFYLADALMIKDKPKVGEVAAYKKADLIAALGIQEISTPMMVVVADGKFKEVILGKLKIEEFMDKINDNTYQPFN